LKTLLLALTAALLPAPAPAVEPDDAIATGLRAACESGNALACGYLGDLYEQGKGVEADPTVAAGLQKRACDGGSLAGCFKLATGYYLDGRIVDDEVLVVRDIATARALLLRACDGGMAEACDTLEALPESYR
jgi:TPR repeat protein